MTYDHSISTSPCSLKSPRCSIDMFIRHFSVSYNQTLSSNTISPCSKITLFIVAIGSGNILCSRPYTRYILSIFRLKSILASCISIFSKCNFASNSIWWVPAWRIFCCYIKNKIIYIQVIIHSNLRRSICFSYHVCIIACLMIMLLSKWTILKIPIRNYNFISSLSSIPPIRGFYIYCFNIPVVVSFRPINIFSQINNRITNLLGFPLSIKYCIFLQFNGPANFFCKLFIKIPSIKGISNTRSCIISLYSHYLLILTGFTGHIGTTIGIIGQPVSISVILNRYDNTILRKNFISNLFRCKTIHCNCFRFG